MKRSISLATFLLVLVPVLAWAAISLPAETISSTVFIANYDTDGSFRGWGSGFFVDEGIVVTNKHVIEGGDWHRVYATDSDNTVDFECFTKIIKSDIRINLNDDVAYMRVFLPCDHGVMNFADDPLQGDPLWVLGYPYEGLGSESLHLTITSGSVIGSTLDGWIRTDAHMDIGSSGGPVVNGTEVLGVSVAKGTDDQGKYLEGYFIPSSVIEKGLLYANDSGFGYTPRSRASSSPRASSSSPSVSSSAASFSSRASASSRSRSSAVSSHARVRQVFPDVPPTRAGYAAIYTLFMRGVIGGYADGTYRPDAGINRAEFVKILVGGFRSDAVRAGRRCFSDVGDEWFAAYVCAAERLGWIEGYADGTYKPDQFINRAEAMKIVTIAFGADTAAKVPMPRDVRASAWYYPYVAQGVVAGIVDPRVLFRPGLLLTREDAAIWIEHMTR